MTKWIKGELPANVTKIKTDNVYDNDSYKDMYRKPLIHMCKDSPSCTQTDQFK